jgi:hypothetical protein
LFFENAQETSAEVEMHDWETKKIECDGNGNALLHYEAPEKDDYAFYELRDGKITKVKKVVFGTPLPNKFDQKTVKRQAKALPYSKASGVCPHCKVSGHPTYLCDDFKSLSVKDRYNSVRDNKLCIRCLSQGHIAKDCKVRFSCDIDKCNKRHHRLLHPTAISKTLFHLFFSQGFESDLDSDAEAPTN